MKKFFDIAKTNLTFLAAGLLAVLCICAAGGILLGIAFLCTFHPYIGWPIVVLIISYLIGIGMLADDERYDLY